MLFVLTLHDLKRKNSNSSYKYNRQIPKAHPIKKKKKKKRKQETKKQKRKDKKKGNKRKEERKDYSMAYIISQYEKTKCVANILKRGGMMFNGTFNNISIVRWR